MRPAKIRAVLKLICAENGATIFELARARRTPVSIIRRVAAELVRQQAIVVTPVGVLYSRTAVVDDPDFSEVLAYLKTQT